MRFDPPRLRFLVLQFLFQLQEIDSLVLPPLLSSSHDNLDLPSNLLIFLGQQFNLFFNGLLNLHQAFLFFLNAAIGNFSDGVHPAELLYLLLFGLF